MNSKQKQEQAGKRFAWVLGVGVLALAVAGAVGGAESLRAQQAPAGGAPATPVQVPPTTHLDVNDGTHVSYRVREQFVGINFPSDASGDSVAVAGTLVVNPDGSIAPGSKLTFDPKSFKSDQDGRDNYIRTRVFEVDKFPTIEFVPKRIAGVASPVPGAGQTAFQLTGDMTIHGVTKEVTWSGVATLSPGVIAGRANADFTFAAFGLMKPMIARLLSVDDKIALELVFKMKRS